MRINIPILAPVAAPRAEVLRLLGYPTPAEADPVALELVHELQVVAAPLLRPVAIFESTELVRHDGGVLELKGMGNLQSPVLSDLLATCHAAAISLVTIGEELEQAASVRAAAGDPVAGMILDAIGSATVEALQRVVGKHLCGRFEPRGLHVTRPWAPGYAGWELAEQHRLFAFLGRRGEALPVRLNESALMLPRKSLSALWGLSTEPLAPGWRAGRVPCRTCDLRQCSFRRAPRDMALVTLATAGSAGSIDDSAAPSALVQGEPIMSINPEPDPVGRSTPPASPAAAHRRVQPVQYPIAPKALGKWMRLHLTCQTEPGGVLHYRFRYQGSTCSNGGIPINAVMHALLRERPEGMVIENGWIEVEDDAGLRGMCEYLHRRQAFVDQLRQPPPFCGQTLEAVITAIQATNPAGCFCKQAMINHKWRQMLSTIHFALAVEEAEPVSEST